MSRTTVSAHSTRRFYREIMRPIRRIASVPSLFWERFFSTLYYDAFLAQRRRLIHGRVTIEAKAAVYLIFPQEGINDSHLVSLKYMIDQGYAPIVVSNAELKEEEETRLLVFCAILIIRPNYGYDFGGYRDGILHLEKSFNDLTHIAVFNDSCWFPMPKSHNWLREAEILPEDFVGALMHANRDWFGVVQGTLSGTAAEKRHKRTLHYCSFAFMFKNRALSDPSVIQFWKRLRLSNSKTRTIRNGERALTEMIFRSGLGHRATTNLHALAREIEDEVRKGTVSEELFRFQSTAGWPAYSLAAFLWECLGFPFIKKNAAESSLLSVRRRLKSLDQDSTVFETEIQTRCSERKRNRACRVKYQNQ